MTGTPPSRHSDLVRLRSAPLPVAVLGGGPAGTTAALLLARWGHHVVVLTRASGAERALGESLPPSCVALLERIGIAHRDAPGLLRSTGNTVRWGGGDERVERFA